MTDVYVITLSRKHAGRNYILKCFEQYDCKKWIIARETGKNGYEHWQIRVETSDDEFFYHATEWFCGKAHIEKSTSEYTEKYERKEGNYITYADNPSILQVRHGKLRPNQQWILNTVETQNDREVDVFLDPKGNHGKSWLSLHLWEQRKALLVPRASMTAKELSAFVCSSYDGEKYIIMDIPRASKPTVALYEAIEELKDGAVYDQRYHGTTRDVRGAKVIVFTNVPLDLKKLSADRWRVHGVNGLTPLS